MVHGKGSLIAKMPGDAWQRFANLRAYLAFMWAHPGKKLLFMGGEFGQLAEWNHDRSLDWHLLAEAPHAGLQQLVRDLNRLYRTVPALHQLDFSQSGFEWIDMHDSDDSVLTFLRLAADGSPVLAACNFTPVVRRGYRVGVPRPGAWREILNGDAPFYGGSGVGNMGQVEAADSGCHGRAHTLSLTLPPLGVVVLAPDPAR